MKQYIESLSKNSIDKEIINLLLEYSSLGIVVCDSSEHILESNKFVCNLLGVEKDKMISESFSKFFSIKDNLHSKNINNLKSIFPIHSDSTSKPVKMIFHNRDGDISEVESHIYARVFGEDMFLLCILDSFTSSDLINDLVSKYSTSLCHKDDGEGKYICKSINELLNMNILLSKQIDKTKNSKRSIENALEKEKQHSEFKTRFVSIASHELRTPLSGILTSASLIEKYNDLNEPQQRQKHINIIKGQVRVLTSILDDFLSLDKLDQPEVRVHLRSFSLNDFFSDFIYSYNEYPDDKGRLNYIHIGDDCIIYQDSDLLFKIINNFVSNGLKYSSSEQSVLITSELVDNTIKIKVKDYGIGIPSSEKECIWELFYRCDNTSGIQGTGLGLNIAKLCSHLIGGKIDFQSDNALGTEFVLSFPKELCK